MDIATRLQELTDEIRNFGDVINFTDDPADGDFRNACDLFSQYLSSQLNSINSNMTFKDIRPEMQQTTAQLIELSELISPDHSASETNSQWSDKVIHFCHQAQSLKKIAA